jgi:synaptobrevin homolog YKT6
MKLLSSIVYRWRDGADPIFLSQTFHLADFSFWQRGSAKEVFTFVTRAVVSRTRPGDRVSVTHEGHLCHVLTHADGLGCAVVSDGEYPVRVAFSFILKTLADFQAAAGETWKDVQTDSNRSLPSIEALIVQYQDPSQADTLMRTQLELDDVRQTMLKNIDQLLARGEKYVCVCEIAPRSIHC